MTYGYYGGGYKWSDWRVSRLLGEKGINGTSIPPGSVMLSTKYGTSVDPHWAIISDATGGTMAAWSPGGEIPDNGNVTYPYMKFAGAQAKPFPPKAAAMWSYAPKNEFAYSHRPVQFYCSRSYVATIALTTMALNEYLRIHLVNNLYIKTISLEVVEIVKTSTISGTTMSYEPKRTIISAGVVSESGSPIIFHREVNGLRHSYMRAKVVSLSKMGSEPEFKPANEKNRGPSIPMAPSLGDLVGDKKYEAYAGSSAIGGGWFEIEYNNLYICIGSTKKIGQEAWTPVYPGDLTLSEMNNTAIYTVQHDVVTA